MGSWREGSWLTAKSKARGSKALGQRSVRGFVDRWVEGSGSKIGDKIDSEEEMMGHRSVFSSDDELQAATMSRQQR